MASKLPRTDFGAQAGPLLPSEISKGNAVTAVSYTPITIDPASDVITKAFCSNGTLYGVSNLVSVPKYFSYVTAPAFMNPKYNMFLLLMTPVQELSTFTRLRRRISMAFLSFR